MERLLIIDDDTKNIFALSAVLRSRGWETLSATNVKEAMQILLTESGIRLILLDMMMPDMDGYEAVNMFKQHPRIKEIPVMAVTAQAMKGDREKCIAAGADEYVAKPVDVDRLLALLHQLINSRSGDIITG